MVAKRIRVFFWNNYLDFTRFSCSITVKFTKNIASNIIAKIMQIDQDTLIGQSLTNWSERLLTALLEYLDFQLSNSYSCWRLPTWLFHPAMVGHFSCCNKQSLLKVFLWCRHLLQLKEYSLVNSEFTYSKKKNQLQYHDKASLMFRFSKKWILQFSTWLAIGYKYKVIEVVLCS